MGLYILIQYGQLVYGWRLLCRTSRRECHRDSFVLVQFCCQLLICTILLSLFTNFAIEARVVLH